MIHSRIVAAFCGALDLLILAASASAASPAVLSQAAPMQSGACALLSQSDVEAMLGGPVGMPRLNQVGDCYWDSLRTRGDSVAVQPKNGGRATFDNDRRRLRNAMPVPGVGDDAYAFVSLAGFVQIGIVKGGRYVILLVQHQGGPSVPTAQSLARNLAARL
jgi:hypothetical protein